MERRDETMVSVYQLLGRIFYATAQADETVRPEEISELKQIVKDVWLDFEDTFDEFNSDSAYQIEIVFDYLVQNHKDVDAKNIIFDLKEYKKVHSSVFTPNMIELIMQTAYRIATAFNKRNKSELTFLSQLRFALQE